MDGEVVNQEAVIQTSNDAPESTQTQEVATPVESEGEKNFRALREAKARAERERDEAIAYAKQIYAQQQQRTTVQADDDDDIRVDDDGYVEGKHLTKMGRKLAKQKQEIDSKFRKMEQMTQDAQLRSTYPDIIKVVTTDNLAELERQDPDLHEVLQNTQDYYKKYAAAYKAIKRLGIYKDDMYAAEKERIQANAKKPKSPMSIAPQAGETPLAKVGEFASDRTTAKERDELWKNMVERYKSRGNR